MRRTKNTNKGVGLREKELGKEIYMGQEPVVFLSEILLFYLNYLRHIFEENLKSLNKYK